MVPSTSLFRHCIEATWLNDRDQFLYPNDKWKEDMEFQTDCLAFTLFHGQNRISCKEGVNHWIPFTEQEVSAREKFESNFMSEFLKRKIQSEEKEGIFREKQKRHLRIEFSKEARAVFEAGLVLWKYYHSKPSVNVNASLYDIKEYFQGRNEKGKMNNKSEDELYNEFISTLRDKLKILARKIEPKVYEYGFLRG